jgi:hypothetical protein
MFALNFTKRAARIEFGRSHVVAVGEYVWL